MHGEPHLDDNFDHGILGIGSINEQFEGGGGVHLPVSERDDVRID